MHAISNVRRGTIFATLLLALSAPALAQFVERPTFAVTAAGVSSLDLAAAPNGTMLVVFNDPPYGKHVFSRRFNRLGGFVGETTIDAAQWSDELVVAVDPHGGFLTAWREPVWLTPTTFRPGLFAHRLDGIGKGIGKTTRVSGEVAFANAPSIVGLPSGSLFVWYDLDGMYMRRYSPSGEPLGDSTLLDPAGGESVILPTSDGGYLLVYRRYLIENLLGVVRMRAHGPSGELRADTTVSEDFDFTDAALAPAEDVAVAVGIRQPDPELPATDIILRRFTPDGAPAGDNVVLHSAPGPVSGPQIEFDEFDNLLVLWGENGGVWARALDATDAPLGPPVQVGTTAVADFSIIPGLRTVRLAGGSFASAWTDGEHAWANVVALCAPNRAVCGDGIHAVTCEGCDDGSANSNTLPDACRTTCRRAGCGDGVVDSGEACDDGNTSRCDGCSATCAIEPGAVCGDGLVSSGCEECDDGGLLGGDGCTSACRLERVLGGGSLVTDCYTEWRVDNPANEPREGKNGGINPQQRCVDDDPRCDFDGGVPGGCTFRVAACANNTNLQTCEPGTRLLSWTLAKPSASQASVRPELAAARNALATVPSEVVGPDARNLCSSNALVPVPLRGGPGAYRPGKLVLGSRAELYTGQQDGDKMKLTCVPRPP